VIMTSGKYTAYTIVSTILTAAILAGIVFILLPELGIHLPFWGISIIMGAFIAYNVALYLLCKKTLERNLYSTNLMAVGSRGITTSPLCPEGTVSIKGEIWKARSNDPIANGEVVIVEGISGLTLNVTQLSRTID
jgi:membrane-bound serine protease (ClpP class)